MSEVQKSNIERLKAAVAAVQEAGVPTELRPAAFEAVLSWGVDPPQASTGGGEADTSVGGVVPNGLEGIAAKLELKPTHTAQVFDVDDEGVHLTIKRARLSGTKKVAQQEVTYLIVAGRQAAGIEEWTSTKDVIEVIHDRGVHDTNVSKAIAALDGDGLRFRGAKSQREIKMNAMGFSKAADIVRRLVE
jgi:hypothetical protein